MSSPSSSIKLSPSLSPSYSAPAVSSVYNGKLLAGDIVPIKNTVTKIKLPDLPGTTNCESKAVYTNMNDIEISQVCNTSESSFKATDSSKRDINVNLGSGSSGQILNCPYSIKMKKTNGSNQVVLDASCDTSSLSTFINTAQFKTTSKTPSNSGDSYDMLYNSRYSLLNSSNSVAPPTPPSLKPVSESNSSPPPPPSPSPPPASSSSSPKTCPEGYKLSSKFMYNVNNVNTEANNVCISSFSVTYPNSSTNILRSLCGANAKSVLVDPDTNNFKCMLN
jgi:hypothetical protein